MRFRRSRAEYFNRRRRAQNGLPPGDPRHGTRNGYTNWGCRCAECRAAHAAPNPPPPGDPAHGKRSTYTTRGCRCDECRRAMTLYQREVRERRRRAGGGPPPAT